MSESKQVVVTLTDAGYMEKAKRTIVDIRSLGEWEGDVVLITVGFDMPAEFLEWYRVTQHRVEHLDTKELVQKMRERPIRPTCDNRQFDKLTQWDKFYVFDEYFKKWDRVVYFDAGLRVVDKVKYLFDLECKGTLMAPDDAAPYDEKKRFGGIIELDRHPDVVEEFFKEYPADVGSRRYFLNCIWMYDTAILGPTGGMKELIEAMNKYPICRCNEMTVMNLIYTFKYGVWRPFPEWCPGREGEKRLFAWTEHDRDYGNDKGWRDFCYLKYPLTLPFQRV